MTADLIYIIQTDKFQLTRPLRGVTLLKASAKCSVFISTHTPLAGRDFVAAVTFDGFDISTHTPLAGRDDATGIVTGSPFYFNSHAPCGA